MSELQNISRESRNNRHQCEVLEIAIDGDPVLKIPGEQVLDIYDPNIQQLIPNMIETMKAANGIGLAAPQVKVSLRIMVFYLPKERDDSPSGEGVPLTVLINPIVEVLDSEKISDFEGCLSIPGMRGKVERYRKIRYSGVNENGQVVERVAEGWHARLVQHEFDHLNGIVYHEHLSEGVDGLITLDAWRAMLKT